MYDEGYSTYIKFSYTSAEISWTSNSGYLSAYSVRCVKGVPDTIVPVTPAKKQGSLTDERNGRTYKTTKIGNQVWMAENLVFDYNEGDAESYCVNNKRDGCEKYGTLYNWSAAMDSKALYDSNTVGCTSPRNCKATGRIRGVCPEGWHLPDTTEFEALITAVGGRFSAGWKLKASEGWDFCDYRGTSGNGTDEYLFSAKPGSIRREDGTFSDIGKFMAVWGTMSGTYGVAYEIRQCGSASIAHVDGSALSARAVRCVKDED